MTVRDFGDGFLDAYLVRAGEDRLPVGGAVSA